MALQSRSHGMRALRNPGIPIGNLRRATFVNESYLSNRVPGNTRAVEYISLAIVFHEIVSVVRRSMKKLEFQAAGV